MKPNNDAIGVAFLRCRLLPPPVLADVIYSKSLLGVGVEYFGQYILGILAEMLGHLVLPCQDLLVQFRCLGVLEGQAAA